jgi:hypothetical protein
MHMTVYLYQTSSVEVQQIMSYLHIIKYEF